MKPTPPAFGRIGSRSGKKYWLLVVVIAIPLFYAQCVWMQGAKRRAPDSPLAEPLARMMMKIKGVPLEEAAPATAAAGGVAGAVGAPSEKIVECDECGGTGRDAAGEACPICFGHGARLLRRGPGEELCTWCTGMGRVRGDDGAAVVDCPRCGGRGLVSPEAEAAPEVMPAAAAETEEQK